MTHACRFGVCLLFFGIMAAAHGEPVVYEVQGGEGPRGSGAGRHVVLIASDHEYKSEEILPMLARILAKHHGFRCTMLFGTDPATGEIKPGSSHIPGTKALDTADLLVIFTRFQNLPADQMQPIVDYLDRGGPVVGLRTATHGFKIPPDSPFAKYDWQHKGTDFVGGFGRQVLGETWVGHYGANHTSSTRLDVVPDKAGHPVLTGVKAAWSELGGYNAHPIEGSEVLMLAQPLQGMQPDAPPDATRPPVAAAWVRSYTGRSGKAGRVFTTTYGGPGDLENDGFRRMLVNACFWAAGLEKSITRELVTDLVGPYRPTWMGVNKRSAHVKPADVAGFDTPILPPPPTAGAARTTDAAWMPLAVPGRWPADLETAVRQAGGVGWYRCWVLVSDGFLPKHERNLYEESVGLVIDDLAGGATAFVNGKEIGRQTTRTEGGEAQRHKVPVGTLQKGQWNEIAIRVEASADGNGFLGEPPFIMNYFLECELVGPWQFQAGDDATPGPAVVSRPAAAGFDAFRESSRVLGRTAQVHGPSLPPAETLARMRPDAAYAIDLVLHEPLVAQPFHASFDERGRLWVTQSRQYPYPAGVRMISRDKYYRSHYDRVPPPPPHHDRGADIVSIHESTRRDGVYDRSTVFLSGLNMANAALRGRGGVWVMHTPHLLFYPDADGDDVPDGPPEVRLSGFGLEDSHSIANGLVWGPDGWLYGAQGSTCSCRVVRPGLDPPDAPGVSFPGCMVWRYHPESRTFEIFCEGGGNNFGLEFDAAGRLFTGHNGGTTRGWHLVQGGLYQMQGSDPGKFGPPLRPHAYGELPKLATPDTVVRFTHFGGFALGTALPPDHAGHLLALDPLHNVVTTSTMLPRGATFETRDGPPAVRCDDPAFRPVFITAAPDGSLCICDMYDFYVAHGQHYQNQIDPTTGRIWRLRGQGRPLETDYDLASKSSADLVGLLGHPNAWHCRTAVRLLGERKDATTLPMLKSAMTAADPVVALHAIWALHQAAGLDEPTIIAAVRSPHAGVREWAVRLACDEWGRQRDAVAGNHAAARGHGPGGMLPSDMFAAFRRLAVDEQDPGVLSQLAASARRLDAPQCLPLAFAVLGHESIADDPYIPLLCWWAIEGHAIQAADDLLAMLDDAPTRQARAVREQILPRLARRYAADGRSSSLARCTQLFRLATATEEMQQLMRGFEEAFRGRGLPPLPADLVAAIERSGAAPLAFRLRRRDPEAIREAIDAAADETKTRPEDIDRRLALVRTLGEVRLPETVPTLLGIGLAAGKTGDSATSVRVAALAALAGHDDPRIGSDVVAAMPTLQGSRRTAALLLLASRDAWSPLLLDAVASGSVRATEIPEEAATRLRGSSRPEIGPRATKLLPVVAPVAGSPRQRVEAIKAIVAAGQGNPYAGESHFVAKCSQCHRMFHKGAAVGPDLTTYQRDNLDTMLPSIVDPSAEIREGYQSVVVETVDGRALNGFFVDRDDRTSVLRTLDGETITLAADDIEHWQPLGRSIMPPGLLDGLDDQQLRDLLAYLRIKQPISR